MKQIRINGRKEFGGIVEAEALVSPKPLEGFTNCDPVHGYTTERKHPIFKVPYEGKVWVNPLSVSCALWAHVPSVTDLEIDPTTVIETGDMVYVNGDEGYIIVTKAE